MVLISTKRLKVYGIARRPCNWKRVRKEKLVEDEVRSVYVCRGAFVGRACSCCEDIYFYFGSEGGGESHSKILSGRDSLLYVLTESC